MKTSYSYRPRVARRFNPVQTLRVQATDTKNPKHPAREEIAKCVGTHNLTAVVEEDMQTLTALRHVEGLVAFIVTLTKDGKAIAQGRGSAVLNPMNRFISRTVASAFNSAMADAAIRATRVLDTLRNKPEGDAIEEAYKAVASEPATEKQKSYLRELVQINMTDEDERERVLASIDEVTKSEASRMIESYKR
ncbi:MAG TPA: hypothetical protein VNM40_04445 [Candidatus Paceibacterota bacterium]|nr:hypothetical protein [Candidatus Paceibacterota bacterium]